MITASVEDLQRDLARYLERVAAGETLLITRADEPVAEVKPVSSRAHGQRPFALMRGSFVVPENFDEPLPEDVLAQFEDR